MDHPAYQSQLPKSPTPGTVAVPEQPVKPSGRNLKKWIIIGGIALVVLLAGTAYVLSLQNSQKPEAVIVNKPTPSQSSPSPDPTADWKTYTNEKIGYSIKYPENTKIDTNLDTAITFSRNITPKPGIGGQGICCGMTLYLRPYGYLVNPSISKDVIINGYAAKLVNHSTYNHSIYINNPDKTKALEVSISTDAAVEPYDKEDFELFDQILQTFKFTDPSPSISVKDPKTACEQNGGKWLADYNECESASGGLDEKTCKELGGTFNACDSACRHDTNPNACIEVCVSVCKF